MQREELEALGELAGDALAGAAGQVHGVHDGIARRAWDALGPLGTPVRVVHDVLANSMYGMVKRSLSALPRGGTRALGLAVPPDSPPLEQSRGARVALGVLNGALGDTLERRDNALALRTVLRAGGRSVEPSRPALRQEFPDATGKLAVFVHGLGETDDVWRQRGASHGDRLRHELGYTPVYVRYNSGRAASASGGELAVLLDRITSNWPVEVHELALIGHCMGGLVARSACERADPSGWQAQVGQVLTLGSPERGAPLEWAAGVASSALARARETRTLAGALSRRSDGLKQLRGGSGAVPFPANIRHYFLDYRRFGPLHHFKLLEDPAVYEQIRARLSARGQLQAPAAQRP